MKFQIGAMTVGDILDRGLKLLFSNLFAFYVINLLVLAPSILMQLFMPELLAKVQSGNLEAALPFMGLVMANLLLVVILQPIGTGAILHIIANDFSDRRVSIGEALQFAMGRFGRLLLTGLLLGVLVTVGLIMCIVPGILFILWYIFYAQVVVVEGLSGNEALSRSKILTEGYRGRVFGLLVLFIVAFFIMGAGAAVLEMVYPSYEVIPIQGGPAPKNPANPFMPPPAGITKPIYPNCYINTIIAQLANILVTTYAAVCMTLLYFDLRIRKEGFDLEFALSQQPPMPGEPPPFPDEQPPWEER